MQPVASNRPNAEVPLTPGRPYIYLTDEDAERLKGRYPGPTIANWQMHRRRPWRRYYIDLCEFLGRDVAIEPASAPAPEPAAPPRVVPRPHIEVNPCVDDGVCLAVRKAAMRPVANTLLDSRREIPCVSCKQGIARAKAMARRRGYREEEATA